MTYSEFVEHLKQPAADVALKEFNLAKQLVVDIEVPDFYHDIAELEGIELMQGKNLTDKPKYDKKE